MTTNMKRLATAVVLVSIALGVIIGCCAVCFDMVALYNACAVCTAYAVAYGAMRIILRVDK